VELLSNLDIDVYLKKLGSIAKLSSLFSDGVTPFIHSRLAERLYCLETVAEDLARRDISFDAIQSGVAGVGIKTFVTKSKKSSNVEKIAELTSYASKGKLVGLAGEALALQVSTVRNLRVESDLAELDLDLSKCFYHCVVRAPDEIFILEQDFGLINLGKIRPTDSRGKPTINFSSTGHVYFEDGSFGYMFNVAKNVLYRRFSPDNGYVSKSITSLESLKIGKLLDGIASLEGGNLSSPLLDEEPMLPHVILPLYSPGYFVFPKSGINQWNANGRKRTFPEAYIRVPKEVHKQAPGFFPAEDTTFNLKLPNGKIVVAKICQQGGKALMSNPNTALCEWLFPMIDGSFSEAELRGIAQGRPYTYSDLVAIGKNSVRVSKVSGKKWDYELESAPIGSYESFIAN
jgi:hypothetical protein